MKNTVLTIAIAAAGFMALPAAHAADNQNGFFVNGNVGWADVSENVYNDSDTGFGFNAGYRWAFSPSVLIGVEGGYADLGKFSPKSFYANDPYFFNNGKVSGWTLGIDGHFNVSDNWYISGRTGWFNAEIEGSYLASPDLVVDVNGSTNDWYVGAGFGYDFSNNFSVGMNYDYYQAEKNNVKLNPSIWSVSAEFRF